MLFIQNGQINANLRLAISEIAKNNLSNFRFSNNQNIIICDVSSKNKELISQILDKYQISNNFNPIRLDAMACVALNTCSLALAEGQRYLPSLISKIEEILAKYNLLNQPISIRLTGCPNGCARPYLADIGLVGRALGKYDLMLLGNNLGTRLNKIYKESLSQNQILENLEQIFCDFSKRQNQSQSFSDWQQTNLNF